MGKTQFTKGDKLTTASRASRCMCNYLSENAGTEIFRY